jgi:hypothetical protein
MKKTTHAASLVKLWYDNQDNSKTSSPTVFAFDRDPARLKTLQNRANNAGCGPALKADSDSSNNKNKIKNKNGQNGKNKTNDVIASQGLVVAECIDFLTVDEKSSKYSNVRSMLVDPSCSGSGIVGIDRAIDKTRKSDKKEIEKIESKKERERDRELVALEGTLIVCVCLFFCFCFHLVSDTLTHYLTYYYTQRFSSLPNISHFESHVIPQRDKSDLFDLLHPRRRKRTRSFNRPRSDQ